MKRETANVFYRLLKKKHVDRAEDRDIWPAFEDPDVMEELETLLGEMFTTYRYGDRVYLVPTPENDICLKTNWDFRRDVSADSTVRAKDISLLNYLSIYLVFCFFGGDGNRRESIAMDEFIHTFTEHCKACERDSMSNMANGYSVEFLDLARAWLGKVEGLPESKRFTDRYGILNRVLIRFNKEHDDLFRVEDNKIFPTRRMRDLSGFLLRKERVKEIQDWMQEVNTCQH